MSNDLTRRGLMKAAATIGASTLMTGAAAAQTPATNQAYDAYTAARRARSEAFFPKINFTEYSALPKPVTAVILGYGNRGQFYASMSKSVPREWQIVGVAEPIDYRRADAAQRYALPSENVFTTWERVFDRPKFADVVVISTQDAMHTGPALRALEAGYDVLLEKPIAQTWDECQQILALARKQGRIVGVCHVLRYAPYFMMLRQVIQSGKLGAPITVQHMEPVWDQHFAHSFVRGPWRNKKESNPVILAKSCHDADMLYYMLDRKVTRVSAVGGLHWFRKEHAPAGAPAHCMDGCPAAASCTYFAPDVYVHKKRWGTGHIVTPDRSPEGILKELAKGQYGRCVYRCDNDVCDHMVTMLEFEGGATASFHLAGLAGAPGRRTRVSLERGWIEGDEERMTAWSFDANESYDWSVKDSGVSTGGHGGGDMRLVRDFCQAVANHDPARLTSNLEASMLSHQICLLAEESRCDGGKPRELV